MKDIDKITQIITLLKKEFPGPEPKPSKSDTLDVLIATMLSQNTTDKTSYRAFLNLKNDIGDWNAVEKSSVAKIKKAIKVCGLANQKSVNIKQLLKNLKKCFNLYYNILSSNLKQVKTKPHRRLLQISHVRKQV